MKSLLKSIDAVSNKNEIFLFNFVSLWSLSDLHKKNSKLFDGVYRITD